MRYTPPRLGAVPRPDWVMFGQPAGDGENVLLFASKRLSRAELAYHAGRMSYDDVDVMSWSGHRVRRDRASDTYTLTAEMDDFVMIIAPSYGEAVVSLFRSWNPDQPSGDTAPAAAIENQRALPPAPPALPPATEDM